MACVSRLRAEAGSLNEQDRLLRTPVARLYARVEFVRENDKIVVYVISALKIVLSGLTLVGGVAMVASMNPTGMLAGATLFIDGINGITREASHVMYGKNCAAVARRALRSAFASASIPFDASEKPGTKLPAKSAIGAKRPEVS